MSIILNIDTSLETAGVSIAENGKILQVLQNNIQKEHASFLHVAVQKLTNQAGIFLKDLDAIAVTAGPGSYTGIRVGLAAAKGLSYALSRPLITITTLDAMTKQAITDYPDRGCFYWCPLIDARRTEVFTAMYNADMQELAAPEAIVLNQYSFGSFLANNSVMFFGSGTNKWKGIVENKNAFFSDTRDFSVAFGQLSFEKYLQKKFADIAYSAPLYVKEFFDRR